MDGLGAIPLGCEREETVVLATLERLPEVCPFMNKIVRPLLFGIFALAIAAALSTTGKPASREFIGAWSAGQLLAQHRNPYDGAAVLALEQLQGFEPAQPVMMSNPPWALPLALPLGFLSAPTALILWLASALGCLAVCLQVFGATRGQRILAYCFAPVFACLTGGAISPFVLLGFSLFVLLQRTRPMLAGAAVLLLSLEPHLLFAMAPVMLLDCVCRRQWRTLGGAVIALAASNAVALCLDPEIWSQYAAISGGLAPDAGSSDPSASFNPPALLRLLAPAGPSGMEWIPCMIAIAGALCFYVARRRAWDWAVDAVPLLFVTMLAAPFASIADQVLLLPGVLVTVASAHRARYAATWFFAINAAVLTLLLAQVNLGAGLTLVTSLAWFAWYSYSRGGRAELRPREYAAQMVEV
jgi:hypothetical protein